MSLKAINERYLALLAVDGCGLYKHMRQMTAKLLAGVASNRGKVIIGGSGFWWQRYCRGGQQMMAMQREKKLMCQLLNNIKNTLRTISYTVPKYVCIFIQWLKAIKADKLIFNQFSTTLHRLIVVQLIQLVLCIQLPKFQLCSSNYIQ